MLHNFSKILQNILQLLKGLQFDMLLNEEQNSKLQKLQDLKTTLAGIHLLFKIVINLKILKNSQEYVYSKVICL